MNPLSTPLVKRRILAVALAFGLAACSGWATTANTRDMAREAEIEKELGQAHPELVEPFRAARIAFDKSDYAEAARLLQEVTAKAPDYDIALRRLGSCLVRQNKRAEGLALCERALALNRSAENLGTLAYALVSS
jgi:tetratricopeptide (TPR) repeat protein